MECEMNAWMKIHSDHDYQMNDHFHEWSLKWSNQRINMYALSGY